MVDALESIRLNNPAAKKLQRGYIYCASGPYAPRFATFAARAKDDPAWHYAELPTGHDARITIYPGKIVSGLAFDH